MLSDRGLVTSLDIKGRGRKRGEHRIIGILEDMGAKSPINKKLLMDITHPIKFEFQDRIHHGHPADTFVDLLEVFPI